MEFLERGVELLLELELRGVVRKGGTMSRGVNGRGDDKLLLGVTGADFVSFTFLGVVVVDEGRDFVVRDLSFSYNERLTSLKVPSGLSSIFFASKMS